MAALNFPSPAAGGDIYQGTNGVTYIYISDGAGGGYWSGASSANNEAPNIEIGNDPPPFPKEGDLWWDSTVTSGRLYVYYEDGDSNQWVEASPAAGEDSIDNLWKKVGNDLSPIEDTDNVIIGDGDITLNADGSGTFANNVCVGDYRPYNVNPSGTGVGVFAGGVIEVVRYDAALPEAPVFKVWDTFGADYDPERPPTFQIFNNGSMAADGNVKIGGTLPSAPNISLNADGKITAVGNRHKFGNYVYNSDNSSGFNLEDGSFTSQRAKSTLATDRGIAHRYGKDITFEVLNDGSAEFAKNVKGRTFTGQTENDSYGCFITKNLAGTNTSTIYQDGRATFAGTVLTGVPYSNVIASGEDALTGSPSLRINQTLDNPGFNSTDSAISVDIYATTGSASVNSVFSVSLDGSAEFVGDPSGGANKGFQIRNSGEIVMRSDHTDAFTIYNKNSTRIVRIGEDGTAYFAGDVKQNQVITRGVYIELEADDDTKYTSTTDADGNETLVYNGETLDVKALLLTLRTAASRIETLETAKASLEARLTALEGAN